MEGEGEEESGWHRIEERSDESLRLLIEEPRKIELPRIRICQHIVKGRLCHIIAAAGEWRCANQHLVDEDAKCPHVHRQVVWSQGWGRGRYRVRMRMRMRVMGVG